ncbi:MAG TPA: hypothetical protein VHG27_02670 [Xanthobacteraceae bacterium]|nr:hypothetical protein [Xanthobacteraceae bacterium]
MSTRTLALASAMALGLGSAAMAQTVIIQEDRGVTYAPAYPSAVSPSPSLLAPLSPWAVRNESQFVDRDNTGVADKVEDDRHENETAINSGN